MEVGAVLTMMGLLLVVPVFLLSEGTSRAICIIAFLSGILVSSTGFAETIRDLIIQVIS